MAIEIIVTKNIKNLIKKKGLKKEFLHTSIGMSSGGFYKMLRKGTYTLKTLEDLAGVLNVEITDLFIKE